MKTRYLFVALLLFMMIFVLPACKVNEPYSNPITIYSFAGSSDPLQQNADNLLCVGARSSESDLLSYSYQLLEGGGSLEASSNSSVVYKAPQVGGTVVVRVTVTDGKGNKNRFDQRFWLEKRWSTIMVPDTDSNQYSKYQSVCVARDGTPYVSAQIYNIHGGIWPLKATTKRYEGGSAWTVVGASTGRAYHIDSVAGDRYPYVVYIDRESWNQTADQLEVWRCGETSHSSNQIQCYTNEFTGMGLAPYNRPKLAMGSDDQLYLASLFYKWGVQYLSVFRYQAAATNWVCIGSNLTTEYPAAVSFIVDKANRPVVASQVGSKNKVYVKQFTGSGWRQLGSGVVALGGAAQPSLALSPDGGIYIAYMDNALGERLTVKKFYGDRWVTIGKAGFTDGPCQWPNLLFDQQGVMYLVFQNSSVGGRVSCMRYTDSGWQYVGMAAGSAYGATFLDAAIAPDGTIYAAYQPTGTRYGTGVVMLK